MGPHMKTMKLFVDTINSEPAQIVKADATAEWKIIFHEGIGQHLLFNELCNCLTKFIILYYFMVKNPYQGHYS